MACCSSSNTEDLAINPKQNSKFEALLQDCEQCIEDDQSSSCQLKCKEKEISESSEEKNPCDTNKKKREFAEALAREHTINNSDHEK